MDFLYSKALHVIFVVTWFSGMFYLVRLFIYNREANDKPEPEKTILQKQFSIMIKRLLFGITLPSAILTTIMGLWLLYLYPSIPLWLQIKLWFVLGLLLYHYSLHIIYKQQARGDFKYSSQQLRVWNEVATLFLVAIIMLVIVRQELSPVYGLLGLGVLLVSFMASVRIYKALRK